MGGVRGTRPPLRVFISHTSELSGFPQHRSFVDVVVEAVVDAGHAPVSMRSFAAEDRWPADVCERHVVSADIYLGLLGHRYGSLIPGRDLSYTEFEYRCAGISRIPRLVFLLARKAPVPSDFFDQVNGHRQDRFRSDAMAAGLIMEFSDAADLKYKVGLSLAKAADTAGAALRQPQVSVDDLRRALDRQVPEVARCSEYIAALIVGDKSELPVSVDGRLMFVSLDAARGLPLEAQLGTVLEGWARLQSAFLACSRNTLPSYVADHADAFRALGSYLGEQGARDASVQQRLGAHAHPNELETSTTADRPRARAMLESLWRDGEWAELERQASRLTDSKDPILRRGARDALLAAIEVRGPHHRGRAARLAAGFADVAGAERTDLLRAGKYAVIADDMIAARLYVAVARDRYPDDPDVRQFAARLGL